MTELSSSPIKLMGAHRPSALMVAGILHRHGSFWVTPNLPPTSVPPTVRLVHCTPRQRWKPEHERTGRGRFFLPYQAHLEPLTAQLPKHESASRWPTHGQFFQERARRGWRWQTSSTTRHLADPEARLHSILQPLLRGAAYQSTLFLPSGQVPSQGPYYSIQQSGFDQNHLTAPTFLIIFEPQCWEQ